MSSANSTSLRVVHIGAFDLASYGDQLYPLVAAHELSRRLPDLELLPFGPLGTTGRADAGSGPTGRADGGLTWALGPWSPDRAAEVARRATLVLCGGGEIVQGDGTVYAPFYGIDRTDAERLGIDRWFLEGLGPAEADCPVVWHGPGVPRELDPETAGRVRAALAHRALVTVRDEQSRRFLEEAGVTRPIEVVPDSALLLPRVLTPEALAHERDRLVLDGAFPAPDPSGDAGAKILVVQGNHTMSTFLDELAPLLEDLPPEVRIVTVSVSPCHNDHLFATGLRDRLTRPTWDVPASAGVEAVAAAITGADCFLGVSLHGAITAMAYGRPSVTFDPYRQAKLAAFLDLVGAPERRAGTAAAAVAAAFRAAQAFVDDPASGTITGLADLQGRIDDHFDRIAKLTDEAAHGRGEPAPVTWSDTGAARQLAFRSLPQPVVPEPTDDPPGLRRPDCSPTEAELLAAVADATETRLARRERDVDEAREVESLRSQNTDLRGAVAHLEGVTDQLQAELALRPPRRGELLRRIRNRVTGRR